MDASQMETESSPPGTSQQEQQQEEEEEVAGPSTSTQLPSVVTALPPSSPASPPEDLSPPPGPSRERWRRADDQALARKVQSLNQRLMMFLSQSRTLFGTINRESSIDKGVLGRAVRKLLSNTEPYFDNLESSARNTVSQYLPMEICTKLLKFSQALCENMEELLLACASKDLFSLEESDPLGVSHFYIGSSRLGQLKVSSFRYCQLTPYLVQVDTGLKKRMRWNVNRLREDPQNHNQPQNGESDGQPEEKKKKVEGDGRQQNGDEQRHEETVGETDYYFLCYEDPVREEGGDAPEGENRGLWSIGRWVQEVPNPETDSLLDWILCEIPQGQYVKLVDLGRNEPSSARATDYMHQLLLSQGPGQ